MIDDIIEFLDANSRTKMDLIKRDPGLFSLQECSQGEYKVRVAAVVNDPDGCDDELCSLDERIDFIITDAEVDELRLSGVEIIE